MKNETTTIRGNLTRLFIGFTKSTQIGDISQALQNTKYHNKDIVAVVVTKTLSSGAWSKDHPTTEPEIAVERDPEAGFEVVAQVVFEGANGCFRLSSSALKERVMRPELKLFLDCPNQNGGPPQQGTAWSRFLLANFAELFGTFLAVAKRQPSLLAHPCTIPGRYWLAILWFRNVHVRDKYSVERQR